MTDNESPAPMRIVVAEDETIIRLDIVETLTAQGYEVVGEADNGQRAIELVEELAPAAVLMDISMPVMDGLTATRSIPERSLAPDVILTAFSQLDSIDQATPSGSLSNIVKPFSDTALVPAIELARARFDQFVALEAEVSDLDARFETRKLVDRAKTLLQQRLEITEPEAFRWIQKTSMDRRLTMRDVAQTVIDQLGNRS